MPSVAVTDTGASFSFSVADMQAGAYSARARIITTDGAAYSSTACEFLVNTSIVFGANEFTFGSQASPMSASGVVHFVVDEPQTFYIEAVGATEGLVRNIDTDDEYPLMYDQALKLWVGELVFTEPGVFRLEAEFGNSLETRTREINTVQVVERSGIVDASTGEPLDNVTLTVFEHDVDTGSFRKWNASAYGQTNPRVVNGYFSVVLPEGEFYLEFRKDEYQTLNSLITEVDQRSAVTALVQMPERKNIFQGAASLFTTDSYNNFTLEVTPLPYISLLNIGQQAPDIFFTTADGGQTTLYDELEPNGTLMFVYSTWNTNAQIQNEIFTAVSEFFKGRYKFIPITTLEPEGVTSTQEARGEYGIDYYQPASSFYDDYYTISLPMFLALNADGKLVGQTVGPRSAVELIEWIEQVFR